MADESKLKLLNVLLAGAIVGDLPLQPLCFSTRVFVASFPQASRSFLARGVLIRSAFLLWHWTSSRVPKRAWLQPC